MAVPLLDLKAQYRTIKEEVDAAVIDVLESQYFIMGPKVQALEGEIAAYTNTPHAVGVSSGTDALLISLMAEGIGPEDEVITTPYSFFATAGCITRVCAKPVFVDIDPVDFNIDPANIQAAVTGKTKAVIPIHLYGQMADMDGVMEAAKGHNLSVIEDGAQAIGCEYKGRRAGSIGDYGCFSFFPSKNLGGAGDGGIVTVSDEKRHETLSIMRVHGGRPKYYHRMIGGNFRLDAIQAAILSVKLKKLDAWTDARQKNADLYRGMLRDSGIVVEASELDPKTLDMKGRSGVSLPKSFDDRRHIYNQFVLRTDRRDEMRAFLKERGIGNEVYYPVPFHKQDCFQYLGYQPGDFPVSEIAAEQTIAVPIYPELTEAQIKEVVEAIVAFHKG